MEDGIVPPAAWRCEIDSWAASLRAAARPSTTIGLRTYHIRRVGRGLGGCPWSVTGDELVAWVAAHDWSRESRRSFRSSARSFWAWGVESGRTDVDPALALPAVKPAEPRPRPAPESAVRAALMAADERVTLMIRLGAEVGMRRAEVAQVHARDIVDDLLGWSLVVHGKGGRERVVPLPDGLAATLRRACGNGYAFPGNVDGHLSSAYVGRLVSRALPEGVTMHQLRHRFATLAHSVNRDMFEVQELLGHVSPETTRRYVVVERASLRATVNAVSGGPAALRSVRSA